MNRKKIGVWIAIAAFCGLLGLFWPRQNYRGISPQGYEITLALYAACNAESQERIAVIESIVESSLDKQQINDREVDWFQAVLNAANEGDWRTASKQSREILMAQTTPR